MILKSLKHTIRKAKSQIREKQKEKTRSSKWGDLRDEFVASNAECAACGTKNHLQVHHVKPFHDFPELELDVNNLITLCMDVNECHINIGHGDSFRFSNPNVREDAEKFRTSTEADRKLIAESAKKNRV